MTKIFCELGEDLVLELDGHATGSPEACAGISALVEALGSYIEADKGHHLYAVHECRVEPGSCTFRVKGDETATEVYRLVCIGLAQIAMACPEQVSISWN